MYEPTACIGQNPRYWSEPFRESAPTITHFGEMLNPYCQSVYYIFARNPIRAFIALSGSLHRPCSLFLRAALS